MAIPFDYTSEYKRKLRTPEEAARVVKSGDWLDISMGGARSEAEADFFRESLLIY